MIIIDFETSYAARTPRGERPHGLGKQSMQEYLHDERTRCLGAAVAMRGKRKYITPEQLPVVLERIAANIASGGTLSAHNATFDLNVWARFYPETFEQVRQAIAQRHAALVDTEHLARYASAQGKLPAHVGTSIAALGEYYGLAKGDTAQAVEAGGETLADYACRDVEIAERVIADFNGSWLERERLLSTIHVLAGVPGPARCVIDCAMLADVATETPEQAALSKKLRKDDTMLAALQRLGVRPEYKTTPAGKQKIALAKGDAFMQGLLTHADPRVRRLAEMRQGAGSNINRTRALTLIKATGNGSRPLPLPMRYYAAHTGRSGGTDGMNVQNMPRGGVHRASIKAPPGHRLVVADASQIEVRVLAWLAGDEPMLAAFRRGDDPYKVFALDLYGLESLDDVTPEQRRVAKSAVLGLGFGAGDVGFKIYCQTMGVDISESECARTVQVYRKARAAVPAYWRRVKKTVARHGAMQLPSGRVMVYPEMTSDDFARPKPFQKRKNERSKLWHGLLTENAVQATARDVTLLHHAVDIAEKWPVVLLVHDEIVCCVPEDQAQACLEDMLATMRKAPAWAEGLPLDAEGDIAVSYGDAK